MYTKFTNMNHVLYLAKNCLPNEESLTITITDGVPPYTTYLKQRHKTAITTRAVIFSINSFTFLLSQLYS